VSAAIIEMAGVSKDYRALRPLRIEHLQVAVGDQIAILGVDRASAEVFVNLVTGAALPDSGDVRLLGRSTASIADSTEWLALVDRLGIVSERAVLLEQLSVVQNLAMPFTLEIEPPAENVRVRAERLAEEVRLPPQLWTAPVAQLDAAAKMRVRLGRALALDPAALLLEHVSAGLDRAAVAAFGGHVRAIVQARGAALIALTADDAFAGAVAARVFRLEPATGRLATTDTGWFRRLLG
jgi:ABC-type transporter Mla maintaining outer membrane lipid asymmetry ATPase subunit MlaF